MAQITHTYILCVFFSLLILFVHSKQLDRKKPCKSFVVYYHDILFNGTDAANATSAVAVNQTNLGNFNHGMMVVFDDPLTKDNHLLSRPVARAQGFFFYDKKDEFNAWFAFTMVFNSTKHKGTINIMGADIFPEKIREFSIVGGTGDIWMTRGIVSPDTQQGNYYFRFKMDVKCSNVTDRTPDRYYKACNLACNISV